MDNLENTAATPTPSAPPADSDFQSQVESLQRTVIYALVLTILVAGSFALFMRRQAQLTRAELDILRPQKEQIDAQHQKLIGPEMDNFLRKLAEYGTSHPDFAPIMTKYGLARPTGATGAPPARATAPATTPAPAKK